MTNLSTSEVNSYKVLPTIIRRYRTFGPLKDAIARDGIQKPLEICTDGTHALLRDGYQRLAAALDLGITEVPVVIANVKFANARRVKVPVGPGLTKLLESIHEPTG